MKDLWVFGYGSLVWRPAFPFLESEPAFIEGWMRRFWQASTDHRGVPGAPGRVVTLVREPGEVCWGRAFRVAAQERAHVLSELDVREKGGYDALDLRLHLATGEIVSGLTYVATPENPNFLGHAPAAAIVEQVRRSVGPSGANAEYVLELDRALREMGAIDPHVREIAQGLRAADRRTRR